MKNMNQVTVSSRMFITSLVSFPPTGETSAKPAHIVVMHVFHTEIAFRPGKPSKGILGLTCHYKAWSKLL